MKIKNSLLMFPDAADGGNANASSAASGSGDLGQMGSGDAGASGQGQQNQGDSSQSSTEAPISTAQKLWGGLVESDKTKAQGQKTDKSKSDLEQGQNQNSQGGQAGTKLSTQGQSTDPNAAGQSGQAATSGQGQQQDQPKNINLTEEMLASLGKKLAESVNPQGQQQQQQQPQMSQEEFDKTFNIYKPSPETWRAIRGEDEGQAIEALTTMLHGAAKQATTIASYLLNHEVQQLKDFIQPAIQMAQEKQLEAMKVEFFEKNQDLKGLDPLLVLIRDQFVAKGTKFKTKDEAFKAVAEEARKQIEAIPGLKAANAANLAAAGQNTQQGQQGQQTSQQTARKMPALSGGQGQRGAGDTGATSGAGAKSTAERIFS